MKKINRINNIAYYVLLSIILATPLASCVGDLDTVPEGPNIELDPYEDAENYPELVSKVYSGFSRLGLSGPDGDADITSSPDKGKTNFLRIYFNMQELTSDEAKCAWNDVDEKNYSQTILTPDNYIGYMMYQRCMLNIVIANEFLKNTNEPKAQVENLDRMRDEVRALRAMNYYFLLDLFGNPGWVADDPRPEALPEQIGRTESFNRIEEELLEIEKRGLLPNASSASYGLVTNQVIQTVLAKMYLNAEVYTGTARWADALKYAQKVTSFSGVGLEAKYQNLFCADNDRSKEIIFALPYDYTYGKDWGGMTFVMAASTAGDMVGDLLDFSASWGGNRATQQLSTLFRSSDRRALFFTKDRQQNMVNLTNFQDGWSVMKFTNKGWDGADNPHGVGQWVDTDFPLFRLADVVLIEAEAELRLGNTSQALAAYNKVHAHARTGLSAATSITLQDILDERGRELYWEAHRRTDLIRFGKFASGYNWAWKGGQQAGVDISEKYKVFPIATKHLTGNPNLKQNPLYN